MGEDRKIVEIEKIVSGGYGLARMESGKVLLVEGAYPGEKVLVRVTRDKKDFAFAKAVEVIKAHPKRKAPPCRYFGVCGGCHFMDMDYEEQLRLKKEMVMDSLKRASIDVEVEDVERSGQGLQYRSKVELTAVMHKGKVELGFKKRYSHDVVPVKGCKLASDKANKIIDFLPKLLEAFDVWVYDFRRKKGMLKHVVIRHAFSTDQVMVIFVTKTESFPQGKALAKKLASKFGWVTSIVHVMNSKDSVVLRGPYRTLYGEGVITEEYDWETYQIPPTAFFQSNYYVSKKLLDFVYSSLQLTGKERVLDLYSGIGFFSMRIALSAKKVVGVESSRISYKASLANANINQRKNAKFVNMEVEDFLKESEEKFDAVVLDPPRGGMDRQALMKLASLRPRRIVYVSCNPPTLARDLKALKEAGYTIERVKSFDMFPQTFHVETVAVLSL